MFIKCEKITFYKLKAFWNAWIIRSNTLSTMLQNLWPSVQDPDSGIFAICNIYIAKINGETN